MKRRNRYRQWVISGVLLVLFMLQFSSGVGAPQHSLAAIQRTSIVMKDTRIRIMPLGDSLTYGQYSSTGGGYRLPLWNDLRARGANIEFVGSVQSGPATFDRANEGHPGWEIDQIAANVVGWLQAYLPQIILLHIGTNDFVKNADPAHAADRLSSLIDEITATLPTAILIVAQIIPLPLTPDLNAEVVAYNQAIPGIVQSKVAQGKHVRYVDMYDAVPADLLPDHIHPHDPGYDLMAQVWLSALLPLLPLNNPSGPV